MKRPLPHEITACILKMRAHILAQDGLSPAEINQGRCSLFAFRLCRHLGLNYLKRAVWFSSLGPDFYRPFYFDGALRDHVVVEIHGRFYDAECPEGVDRPEEIPAWKFRFDRARYSSLAGKPLPILSPLPA